MAARLTTPPAPLPVDAPAELFSAGRALRDIAAIARAPHPTGTVAHAQARAHILARLRALGLQPKVLAFPLVGKPAARLADWARRDVSRVGLADVTATWPGRDRNASTLVLMAHYDTVWGSPGAADDSAGVVTLIEDLRAMRAEGVRPERDIVLLFTDGEELGLAGAHAYFERPGIAARIGMVVNHETRGGGGRTAMFETGLGNGAAMRLFAHAVPRPMVTSLSVLVYRLMPNSTDLTVALKQGLPGYNFAFIGRPALYHSPLATPAAIEPAAIQDMGDQSLALVRALATAPALPAPGSDAVFGDLLGLATIAYPPIAGWGVIAGAALLLALGTRRLRHEGKLAGRDTVAGCVAAAFTVALAAPLLAIGNALSTGWAKPEYYDRLAAIHRLEAQAAAIGVAVLLAGLIARRTTPRWAGPLAVIALGMLAAALGGDPLLAATAIPVALLALALPARSVARWPASFGAIVLVLVLALCTQVAAPLAASLFAWPALLAAAAFAIQAWRDRAGTTIALAIPLGLGLAQTLALAHFTFGGIGAPLPLVILPFVATALALTRALLDAVPRSRPLGIALLALLVVATAIASWVRLDPVAPSVPNYLGR